MRLEIDAQLCRMLKISNNLLKVGSGHEVEFTIPIEGLMLNAEQLNTIMGDPITHRSWFNQRGDVWEPCAWWAHGNGSFPIEDTYEAAVCVVRVSGDQDLEFEGEEGEDDDEQDVPAARLTRIRFTPHVGGLTEMAFHLHVRPGIGKTNLQLQEHQHREIRLTIGDAQVAEKRGAQQQSLPLDAPRPVSGGFEPQKSGEEIDAELAARNPDGPKMGDDGWPPPDDATAHSSEDDAVDASTPNGAGEDAEAVDTADPAPEGAAESDEDLARIEQNMQAQVAAYNARPGEVIDGTTPRSRRRRRGEQAGAH